MKYIKDIKAILLEIGMAFFGARVHEVNRFFLPATKKKRNTETGKKEKGKRKLEKKEKQRKSGRRKEA